MVPICMGNDADWQMKQGPSSSSSSSRSSSEAACERPTSKECEAIGPWNCSPTTRDSILGCPSIGLQKGRQIVATIRGWPWPMGRRRKLQELAAVWAVDTADRRLEDWNRFRKWRHLSPCIHPHRQEGVGLHRFPVPSSPALPGWRAEYFGLRAIAHWQEKELKTICGMWMWATRKMCGHARDVAALEKAAGDPLESFHIQMFFWSASQQWPCPFSKPRHWLRH